MSKEVENLHLQAFNRTVKDLLAVEELYIQHRLSGEKYDRTAHENAIKECGLEVRQAALTLFYVLGMKYEWTALQRGISELEAERESFALQIASSIEDGLRTCRKCGDRLTTRRDGVCEACFNQYVIDATS